MQPNTETSTPHPTQEAYKPTTNDEVRKGILLGVTSLIIFAVGVALWVFGIDFFVVSGDDDTTWNALIIAIGAPLMLLAAFYFFYTTWRDWQRSSYFNQNKQRTRGTITHLWTDKDVNQRKVYNVGYQYADGQAAYQSVPKRRYDTLVIGEEVQVEYVPGDPKLSYFEPISKRMRRQKVDNAAG